MTDTERLLDMIGASWKSQAICVAAQLQLADHLATGAMTSDALAQLTDTHPQSLHRLLAALATIDIVRQRADGAFEITPTGALLATTAHHSLHAWAIWWGQHLWPVWGKLGYSVQTGKSARSQLTGATGFDHLKSDPAAAETFNRAMEELTRIEADGVMQAYDFSGLGTIVDVGGGYGQMIARILADYPAARGVLFDLPHAIDRAQDHLGTVAQSCRSTSGDFFQSVPTGGDAYILKNVLHDWDDERATAILTNCRRAMTPTARLLIIERVFPDRMEPTPAHQNNARADLTMLVALAARERTEAQFRALLQSAGFEVNRVIPAGMAHSIIEASVAART